MICGRERMHVRGDEGWMVGEAYLATTVFRSVDFVGCDPAFLETLLDELAEVFVVGVSWAVVAVQSEFEIFSGGAERRELCESLIVEDGYAFIYKFWTSCRNSRDRCASF